MKRRRAPGAPEPTALAEAVAAVAELRASGARCDRAFWRRVRSLGPTPLQVMRAWRETY